MRKKRKKKSRRVIRIAACEAGQPEIFALGSPWPSVEFSAAFFLRFLRLFAAIPSSSRPCPACCSPGRSQKGQSTISDKCSPNLVPADRFEGSDQSRGIELAGRI
jgi:hypothetical protein